MIYALRNPFSAVAICNRSQNTYHHIEAVSVQILSPAHGYNLPQYEELI